jgi:hypothetical protein
MFRNQNKRPKYFPPLPGLSRWSDVWLTKYDSIGTSPMVIKPACARIYVWFQNGDPPGQARWPCLRSAKQLKIKIALSLRGQAKRFNRYARHDTRISRGVFCRESRGERWWSAAQGAPGTDTVASHCRL